MKVEVEGSACLELEHPELDEGVLLRADSLARGAVVVGADLPIEHAVHVRALPELHLVVRLTNKKKKKKSSSSSGNVTPGT